MGWALMLALRRALVLALGWALVWSLALVGTRWWARRRTEGNIERRPMHGRTTIIMPSGRHLLLTPLVGP